MVVLLFCAAQDADRLQAQTLTDRQILEAFYTATNGDSWTTSTNWNDDNQALNNWHGVTADSSDNVTQLSLAGNGLSGSLPSSLGQLSSLTHLILPNNQLSGSIPAELGNLSSLTRLNLPNNRLSGSIPSQLGQLSSLERLELTLNKLTGSIPSQLGSLSALSELYLNGNSLSGSIPRELGNAGSSGTGSARIDRLQSLFLGGNDLTGEIPAELGKLSNLERLYLNNNELTGSIPSELGNLSALRILYLNENELSGSIPAELGNLSNLQWLYLHINQLTGQIPSELGNAGSSVDENGVRTDKLSQLWLSDNRLTGEIPSQLGDLSKMGQFVLRNNNLTGSIPPQLGDLPEMYWLYLSGNNLSGKIPSELGKLTKLQDLRLDNNQLSGSIPSEVGNLGKSGNVDNLLSLFLHKNQLTGSIPSELGQLSSLEWLYLDNNRLTGSIPAELVALPYLYRLLLHDNELTGAVPDLSDVPLYRLGLGGNNFDNLSWDTLAAGGAIDVVTPRTFVWPGDGQTYTANLLHLYLHDSGLTGDIPDWIGTSLTSLQYLWLQNNGLTGAVPSNFSNLTNLVDLRLHGNILSGGYNALEGLGNLDVLSRVRGTGEQVFQSGGSSYVVKLAPSQDAAQPRVRWTSVASEDVRLDFPPPPSIARVVEIVAAVDIEVEGDFTPPVVVCVPVPDETAVGDDQELVLLHEFEDGMWRVLESSDPPSGYDPGDGNTAVCGMTDSFSVFGAAVVDVVDEPMATRVPIRPAPILRIEPSIRSATVSEGDLIRLRFDIYGRQDILDNELGKGHVFEWSDGGAGGSFRATERLNEILYTVPDSPGKTTLTVTSPLGACLGGDDADEVADRCTAEFTITVRRASAVPEERPAPKNPIGEIPSVLVDAEGRQYEVFTPEGGGSFNGDDVTISADAGVVPNLEIVGVRADVGGSASNIGMTGQRYTLAGEWYEVRAVDADESAVSGYVLESPLSVCLPLPDVLSSNISNVALVASNADGSLTILASSVRITASGTRVCGGLGTLPASVAVGRLGSPAGLPTATPEVDEVVEPDTGGWVPGVGVLVLLMVVGIGVVGVVVGKRLNPDLKDFKDGV